MLTKFISLVKSQLCNVVDMYVNGTSSLDQVSVCLYLGLYIFFVLGVKYTFIYCLATTIPH